MIEDLQVSRRSLLQMVSAIVAAGITGSGHVPDEALAHWRLARERGARLESEWNKTYEAYRRAHPQLAVELDRGLAGRLADGWDAELPTFAPGDAQATRAASGKVFNALASKVPELFGGSADLAGSTNLVIKNGGDVAAGRWGGDARNVHFGIREHVMGAILNGLALHGGVRPVGSTFLIFSDYMRPPMRLAAMTHLPVIYVFTHDSIGLGEDGPTHQPIEQLTALRAIPKQADGERCSVLKVSQRDEAGPLHEHDGAAPVFDRKLRPITSAQSEGELRRRRGSEPLPRRKGPRVPDPEAESLD